VITSGNLKSLRPTVKETWSDLDSSSSGDHIWIEKESPNLSITESVAQGAAALVTPVIANSVECAYLKKVCSAIADSHRQDASAACVRIPTLAAAARTGYAGDSYMNVAEAMGETADDLVEKILGRVFDWLDAQHPSLVLKLFGPDVASIGLRQAFHSDMLEFTPNEPAINVYSEGGQTMNRHLDYQALTILVPLTEPSEFQGGGTGFWTKREVQEGIEEPSLVLKPSAGSALLFCGNEAQHTGMPVSLAERAVLVVSLSARDYNMGSGSSLLAEILRKGWQQSNATE
jgi:hypothetical protein